MQISDLAEFVRGLDDPSVAPLIATLRQTLDSLVEIGLGYLSLDRAVRHAVRRRGAAREDGPAPRAPASPTSRTSSTSRPSGCTRTTSSG